MLNRKPRYKFYRIFDTLSGARVTLRYTGELTQEKIDDMERTLELMRKAKIDNKKEENDSKI